MTFMQSTTPRLLVALLGIVVLFFGCKDSEKKLKKVTNSQSDSSNIAFHIPSDIQDYYKQINFNQTGDALYDDLAATTIAKHVNIQSYSARHKHLYDVDGNPKYGDSVILMYSGEIRFWKEYISGGNHYKPQSFNTEHVYPQSLIINTAKGDLHHLRVCDRQVNSKRGNLPFTDGQGAYKLKGKSWYPGERWEGDVARMIMYLNLRYAESFEDVGSLELFLKWNAKDPVSEFEIQRNNRIEKVQGNRNPFIDNPYLATIIWGGIQANNRWD
ncbi:endonuclease I family protein [Galbibacter sp.]|uniref:endonuclease I family protein n=1 Tax=Galbibacter sp. TaxID=2918471 RepID=UPI003A8F2B8A